MLKTIFIAPPILKKSLLKEYLKKNLFVDLKFYTLDQLLAGYFGQIDYNRAFMELSNSINDFDLIDTIIEKMAFLPLNFVSNDPNISYLLDLKAQLVTKGIITFDPCLEIMHQGISNQNTTIISYYHDPFSPNTYLIIDYILNEKKLNFIKEIPQGRHSGYQYYSCLNEQEQLLLAFNQMASLIDSGVMPSQIEIAAPQDELFLDLLKTVASEFKIPLNLSRRVRINELQIAKIFLKMCATSNDFTRSLSSYLNDIMDGSSYPLYREFSQFIADLSLFFDFKANNYNCLEYLFKKSFLTIQETKDGIRVLSPSANITAKYFFVLDLTLSNYLKNTSDLCPFTDHELKQLGLDSYLTITRNLIVYAKLQFNLSFCAQSYLYHSKVTFNQINKEFNPFYQLDDETFFLSKVSPKIEVAYSKKAFNRYYHYLSYMHQRYHLSSELLPSLAKEFGPISSFDHSFYAKNLNFERDDRVSASQLNAFLACPFQYYLTYIVRLNQYQVTTDTILGEFIHAMLEEYIASDKIEFDSLFKKYYQKYIAQSDLDQITRHLFLNLYDFLKTCLEIIKERISALNLPSNKISILTEKAFNGHFKGVIDLIIVLDDHFYIIDYKTTSMNNLRTKLKRTLAGRDLQLAIYSQAATEIPELKNKKLLGVGYYLPFIKSTKESLINLERHLEGRLFVNENSNGEQSTHLKSLFASEDLIPVPSLLKKLATDVDQGIKSLNDAYQKHEFAIEPDFLYRESGTKSFNPCELCAYHAICAYKNNFALKSTEDSDEEEN